MALFTLGINHRTAPLQVREQLAFHAEELRRALSDLMSSGHVHEAAILSTCNRTELYCQADTPQAAIDWLADFLRKRPSTYQELHPEFITQLGAGWKKHEAKPELLALLEDNFIRYDGTGEVPSQIHAYLSTNHKDLRGLDKAAEIWIVG